MAKVYDCFSFFNELDLLEIRFHELDSVVDHFVVIEATRTFQNQPKELIFLNNQDRYKKFLSKIIHVKVDQFPTFWSRWKKVKAWDFEANQRNALAKVLPQISDDDVLILSDVDEIPRADLILKYKDTPGIKVFEHRMFYYYLNCFVQDYDEPIPMQGDYKPWRGSLMLPKRLYKRFEFHRTQRNKMVDGQTYIPEGGWHFSWLGGVQAIVRKIEAYSHTELNNEKYKDTKYIRQCISEGKDLFGKKVTTKIVPVEGPRFPQYILDHMEKFEPYIL